MKKLIFLILLIPFLIAAGPVQKKHLAVIAAMNVTAPGGCSGIAGNNATTDDGSVSDSDVIAVKQITATCDGTLPDIFVRVGRMVDIFMDVYFVLYSDSGSNVPLTLLESHLYPYDSVDAVRWISEAFAYSGTNGVKYWIGIMMEGDQTGHYYSSTSGGVGYSGAGDFGSGPATNWSSYSSRTSLNYNFECYVQY
jgi:hypothetical protein